MIEQAGHRGLFLPRLHCELNPIETYWGYAKRRKSIPINFLQFSHCTCAYIQLFTLQASGSEAMVHCQVLESLFQNACMLAVSVSHGRNTRIPRPRGNLTSRGPSRTRARARTRECGIPRDSRTGAGSARMCGYPRIPPGPPGTLDRPSASASENEEP
jgi:hypothetical protein